jgi:hypothetical protein
MNASRPEADTEYSRASGTSEGDSGTLRGSRRTASEMRSPAVAVSLVGGGLIGAALLLVAEFTPLLSLRSSAHSAVITTIGTGPHQSYALVPVALLVLGLTFSVWASGNRLALLATGLMGLLALAVALLGDLPDARASGLIGSATRGFAAASASPGIGLYLETLGAIVLMITAGVGLLLQSGPTRAPRSPGGTVSAPRRSAS